MKIYVVRGFYRDDWEDHFLVKAFMNEEKAEQFAADTTSKEGREVRCFVETVELEE